MQTQMHTVLFWDQLSVEILIQSENLPQVRPRTASSPPPSPPGPAWPGPARPNHR